MERSRRPEGPTELILFERWMDTTQWLMGRTQRFPKSIRHTLTHRMESLALAILEDLTSAAYGRRRERALRSADDRLDRLRVLVRLAHEMGHLGVGPYEEAGRRLGEAGRMLGGWRRSAAGSSG